MPRIIPILMPCRNFLKHLLNFWSKKWQQASGGTLQVFQGKNAREIFREIPGEIHGGIS